MRGRRRLFRPWPFRFCRFTGKDNINKKKSGGENFFIIEISGVRRRAFTVAVSMPGNVSPAWGRGGDTLVEQFPALSNCLLEVMRSLGYLPGRDGFSSRVATS